MKLPLTQIIPSTTGIKGVEIKNLKDVINLKTETGKWADRMVQFLDETFKKVASIPFNRSENLNVADTGGADTTYTLTHHLGRVPSGLLVSRIDKAGIIYVDSTDFGNWSTTEIKFKCSVANALIKVFVF